MNTFRKKSMLCLFLSTFFLSFNTFAQWHGGWHGGGWHGGGWHGRGWYNPAWYGAGVVGGSLLLRSYPYYNNYYYYNCPIVRYCNLYGCWAQRYC